MSKLHLQNIVDDISFENLPVKWQGFDFVRFSKDKALFDFQQNALKNALKALHLFFKDRNADKKELFDHYKLNGLEEDFDYDLKKKQDSKTAKYLLEYPEDYPIIKNKISYAYFINRMSFWMATGSGKTLIIVKLIELLGKLIAEKELPTRDILFLTHRDDLLDQFKNHVDEFNNFNFETKINLKSLRDYESVKRENALPFGKNEITVFYYRSDLISDEHKEKIVNFKNYDNSGKWYILLDEAHKGDKEDSKRQILYSILSRNGFLFNFSATFTDPRDFATCAFNFNLSRFVEEGYGKHIYVSQSNISAFKSKDDFSLIEKQKIVLKTLLLLTYIDKYFEEIRKVDNSLYHCPLLLTLVNSVNVEEADLELFFRELERVARNEIRADLLKIAKEELVQEFRDNTKFVFEELECTINADLASKLDYEDILKYALNAKTPGSIEVLKIPGNRNELIFKLRTAEKPFALIKIGDISGWLKDKLEGYEINESFENESYFRRINSDDSDINILMGSRSFYEGWDSNRPNLLLFVNIGVGSDAKKFVLQSVGRGVRIEPQKNKRKRLQNLYNANEVDKQLFEKAKNLILPIESLFVFGTNAENLKEIIATLKAEKQDKSLGEAFILNPEAQKHLLLVPVYKNSERIFAEEKDPQKYPISREDFDITSKFYGFLGDKIALAKYDCEAKILKKTEESFAKKNRYYDFNESNSLFEPELILGRIFDYFSVKSKEFDKFKELKNEIVHFKHVRFSDGEKYQKILEAIGKVKNYPQKVAKEKGIDEEFERTKDKEKYKKAIKQLELDFQPEIKCDRLKIKYLANHYYLPMIVSETEKIDYLNHIINVDSEVRFIEQLEEYLAKPNNIFVQFDWWMFSKLDQTLDDVTIPYYNPKENKMANFKPDFIFWMQKDKRYLILFVDPKGTNFADYQHKVDGYRKIFENKVFLYNEFNISTKLLLYTNDIAKVGENYKRYWFDNFDDFEDKIKLIL
ncbi:DEAD/DEAH box helicase family protein [Thermodesulfobium sp. 4217-1]|uniref:DEAD/DEAH box helicase family protein n=1 Tax=Thermodesulfobium sp. 4217-1 TaxID=3120013 RepID=UPI00322199A8